MKNSFLLIIGFGILTQIHPGYSELSPSSDKSVRFKPAGIAGTVLDEMLMAYSGEITKGYDEAPRFPDIEISSSPVDVHFYLYSNDSKESPFHELKYNWKSQCLEAPIKPYAPWKILIHGFTQNQNSTFPQLLVNEYLKSKSLTGKEYNILVVDWGQLAFSTKLTALPIYSKAVENVAVAGERVGQMIIFLKRLEVKKNVTAINDLSRVHIIGFSLGAHVAGVAGDYVRNKLSRAVGRISGLDPAGPRFYSHLPESGRQLNAKDAGAMDIIHTSWNTYGIGIEIGDANFYPNAGPPTMSFQVQPWCLTHATISPLVCSHNLAPVFYALSINHPGSMEAFQCGSWASYKLWCPRKNIGHMGEDWDPKEVGRYYLDLSSKALDDKLNNLKSIRKRKHRKNSH